MSAATDVKYHKAYGPMYSLDRSVTPAVCQIFSLFCAGRCLTFVPQPSKKPVPTVANSDVTEFGAAG
jgi:hypothetical protein